jgi:translation initiation factor IF-2
MCLIISAEVGAISESDIQLAESLLKQLSYGFHTQVETRAEKLS